VWHLDEPISDAAAISTFLICDTARSSLKVLLSGQGGDEIFAGYHYHLAHRLSEWVRHIPEPVRRHALSGMLRQIPRLKQRVPGVHPGLVLAFHRYFDKLLRGASLPADERFVAMRSYFSEQQLSQLYHPELRAHLGGSVPGAPLMSHFKNASSQNFTDRMLYVDTKTFLTDLNLTYSDKMSAAVSMEVRVPLLDAELIEFVRKVPAHLKIHGLTTKYIFRKALKGILPEPIIRRRKVGFGGPTRAWLRRDLRVMLDDVLSEDAVRCRGYFEPSEVRRMITEDRSGLEDHSHRIWMLLTLELWQQAFLDRAITEARPESAFVAQDTELVPAVGKAQ